MNIQLTQKQLCEILSRSLGATVDSVEIVECKEDVKSGKVGEAFIGGMSSFRVQVKQIPTVPNFPAKNWQNLVKSN